MNLRLLEKIIFKLRGEIDLEILIRRGLKVGSNCSFQQGVRIDSSHCWLIEIGTNVTLAPRVMIFAHDASMKKHLGYTKIGKVKIGNNVFIGAGSIILPNVKIGENSIIGSGSIITKDIPENVIASGNPARILMSLDEFLIKHNDSFKKSPKFGVEYTLRQDVNKMKKEEMIKKIEKYGYVI